MSIIVSNCSSLASAIGTWTTAPALLTK
jgi:hypothetical protein